MEDIDIACTMIANESHEDATVIWGVAFDPAMEDAMKITIIATGFEKEKEGFVSAIPQSAPAAQAQRKPEPAPAPAPVAESADEISDDDLDELLGMFGSKERKPQEPAQTDYPSGLKRYF